MLVIRLLRTGKKNQPSFKIVVVEKTRSSTSGRFVEEVGFYNSQTKEKVLRQERIKYWLSVGAKPLETVHNLLISEKIIEGKKIKIYRRPKKEKGTVSAGTPVAEKTPATPGAEPIKESASAETLIGKEEKPPAIDKNLK